MGRIYKRGDTYHAEYRNRAGKIVRVTLRTSDQKVAKARLRDLELQTTDSAPHETEAIADALDYFVNVASAAKSDETQVFYAQKARHLTRLLGNVLLSDLRGEHLERYIAQRENVEGAHPHTVDKELTTLSGALSSAKERERWTGSVAVERVIRDHDAQYTPRETYLTPEQFFTLLGHLVPPLSRRAVTTTQDKIEHLRAERALYCLIIVFAGPRKGEIEKLRWSDVDLKRGVLQIPKGKTRSRKVPIADALRPWLQAFGDLCGWRGPVVKPWLNMVRDLELACERAGVPRVTANDLRRTFGSWLVQARESLYVVAQLMGHSTTRMVELVYGRLSDETFVEAIGKLPGAAARAPGVRDGGARGGTEGTDETPPTEPKPPDSLRITPNSTKTVVPRVGVEPTARGFSGQISLVVPEVITRGNQTKKKNNRRGDR